MERAFDVSYVKLRLVGFPTLQDGLRGPQDCPKTAHEGPKKAQEAPKTA